jgi:HSP20 family molecular chaperone IbpA
MTADRTDVLRDDPDPRASTGQESEARYRRRNFVRPPVDIYSTDTEMVILADMPGLEKSRLDVTLERDELVIEGKISEREREESSLPWGYHRRFRLRTDFDRNAIHAKLKAGILHLTLPKAASAKPQKVVIG